VDCWRKSIKQLLPAVFKNGGHGGFGRKFSQKWCLLRFNSCRCYNKTVLLETPVDIFGEKSSKVPDNLKVLEFLTG